MKNIILSKFRSGKGKKSTGQTTQDGENLYKIRLSGLIRVVEIIFWVSVIFGTVCVMVIIVAAFSYPKLLTEGGFLFPVVEHGQLIKWMPIILAICFFLLLEKRYGKKIWQRPPWRGKK